MFLNVKKLKDRFEEKYIEKIQNRLQKRFENLDSLYNKELLRCNMEFENISNSINIYHGHNFTWDLLISNQYYPENYKYIKSNNNHLDGFAEQNARATEEGILRKIDFEIFRELKKNGYCKTKKIHSETDITDLELENSCIIMPYKSKDEDSLELFLSFSNNEKSFFWKRPYKLIDDSIHCIQLWPYEIEALELNDDDNLIYNLDSKIINIDIDGRFIHPKLNYINNMYSASCDIQIGLFIEENQ